MIFSVNDLENRVNDIKLIYSITYNSDFLSYVNYGTYYFLLLDNTVILIRIVSNNPIEIDLSFTKNYNLETMGDHDFIIFRESDYYYKIKYEDFIKYFPILNNYLNQLKIERFDYKHRGNMVENIKVIVLNTIVKIKRQHKIDKLLNNVRA